MTSQGSAHGRFQRAIERRQVFQAEIAARELGFLSLQNALALVVLHAEEGSPKFESAPFGGLRVSRSREKTCGLPSFKLAAGALASLRGLRRERAEKALLPLL